MQRRVTCLAALALAMGMLAAVVQAKPTAGTITLYLADLQYCDLVTGQPVAEMLSEGTATCTAELEGNFLMIAGTYQRLQAPILPELAYGVHVHHDPALDHLDTLVGGLENQGNAAYGSIGGAVHLTAEQRAMLDEGRLYIDIHTTAFPEGEIQGMLRAVNYRGNELSMR